MAKFHSFYLFLLVAVHAVALLFVSTVVSADYTLILPVTIQTTCYSARELSVATAPVTATIPPNVWQTAVRALEESYNFVHGSRTNGTMISHTFTTMTTTSNYLQNVRPRSPEQPLAAENELNNPFWHLRRPSVASPPQPERLFMPFIGEWVSTKVVAIISCPSVFLDAGPGISFALVFSFSQVTLIVWNGTSFSYFLTGLRILWSRRRCYQSTTRAK